MKLTNSWGRGYPLVWVPYDTLQRLLDGIQYPGEATIITDRTSASLAPGTGNKGAHHGEI